VNLETMFKNWQPTLASLVTAFFGFVAIHPEYFQPWLVDVAAYAAMGGLVAFGLSAKQHNVTGGTVPIPSNEAAKASVMDPTSTVEGEQK
jgi:hypothetical protein